jgi:ammonia channel protein AmtB
LNRSTVNLAHAKVTASNGRAANAFVVTNTGATAGLVAITPASGEVGSMPAVFIGLGAGVFCCGAAGHKVYYRDASTGGGKTESKTE